MVKSLTREQLVRRFMEGAKQLENMDALNSLYLRGALHTEEHVEFLDALNNLIVALNDKAVTKDIVEHLLKELTDLQVILSGTVVTLEELGFLPEGSFTPAFNRTMASNMSKLIEPEWREDGKLLKGPNYQPPNLKDLLND